MEVEYTQLAAPKASQKSDNTETPVTPVEESSLEFSEFTEEEAPFAGPEVDLSDESLAIFNDAILSIINDVFAN